MSDTLFKKKIISLSDKKEGEVKNDKFPQQQHFTLNSQALISLESQQTDRYLISDPDIGREFLYHQNGAQSNGLFGNLNQTNQPNNQTDRYSTNEDYINILEDKQNKKQGQYEQQKLYTNSQIVRELIGEDEHIEIIEDEEENNQNFQYNMKEQGQITKKIQLEQQQDMLVKQMYDKKNSINELTENKLFNPSLNYQKNGQKSLNDNGEQFGKMYKKKLKNDEENNTNENTFKDSENQIQRGNTFSGNNTNGQRLWSIVRRDIFYPIKFHGNNIYKSINSLNSLNIIQRKEQYIYNQFQQYFLMNTTQIEQRLVCIRREK